MHLQAQEAAKRRSSLLAKLVVLQQHLHQKQSQLEATQADYLQAQVNEHSLTFNNKTHDLQIFDTLIEFLLCYVQVNTQALNQAASNAEDGEAGSRFARFDQACLELFQMGRAGKLPGTFFGRVCNIAQVVGTHSAAAVNAVAKEAVNLVSCCWAHMVYPMDAPVYTSLSISHAVAHLSWQGKVLCPSTCLVL